MTDKETPEYEANIEKKDGDALITAEVTWETLQNYRQEALAGLRENVSIDGFRKGKIPEDVLEDHVGEMGIVSEMAQLAIQSIYPKIIADNELQTIGRPDVKITKISKGNPLEFEATATMMPTVELPNDYLDTASEAYKEASDETSKEEDEVSDEEVDKAIETIRQQWAQNQKQIAAQESDKEVDPTDLEVTEDDLPEIDDDFVQKISNDETLDDFKATLKENIGAQNKQKAQDVKRGKMIQAVVDSAEVELPSLVIEGELDKMMAQFESDVARSGMDMEDYFEQTNTSKDEMRDKWRPDAKRRAKTQLVLNKIAAKENIQADDEAVEKEVTQIKEQYEQIPEARARTFVRSRMINENTIKFLESQATDE